MKNQIRLDFYRLWKNQRLRVIPICTRSQKICKVCKHIATCQRIRMSSKQIYDGFANWANRWSKPRRNPITTMLAPANIQHSCRDGHTRSFAAREFLADNPRIATFQHIKRHRERQALYLVKIRRIKKSRKKNTSINLSARIFGHYNNVTIFFCSVKIPVVVIVLRKLTLQLDT